MFNNIIIIIITILFGINLMFSNITIFKYFETERIDWIKQVLYILAIYGENKIYEFIFRDPEYQNNLKSNTNKSLNINSNNETIDTLKRFEKAFKDSFSGEIQNITSQRYLELYFEYVFGKILKRED